METVPATQLHLARKKFVGRTRASIRQGPQAGSANSLKKLVAEARYRQNPHDISFPIGVGVKVVAEEGLEPPTRGL